MPKKMKSQVTRSGERPATLDSLLQFYASKK